MVNVVVVVVVVVQTVRDHEDLDCRDLGRPAALSREEMMSRPMIYVLYAGNTIQRPLLMSVTRARERQSDREREAE